MKRGDLLYVKAGWRGVGFGNMYEVASWVDSSMGSGNAIFFIFNRSIAAESL